MTAANFSQVAVTTTTLFNNVHPDFSGGGAPIQFGFFRANGSGPSTGYILVAGIDNWQVSIAALEPASSTAAIPTLGAMAMSILALLVAFAGMPYLRRR